MNDVKRQFLFFNINSNAISANDGASGHPNNQSKQLKCLLWKLISTTQ